LAGGYGSGGAIAAKGVRPKAFAARLYTSRSSSSQRWPSHRLPRSSQGFVCGEQVDDEREGEHSQVPSQ